MSVLQDVAYLNLLKSIGDIKNKKGATF